MGGVDIDGFYGWGRQSEELVQWGELDGQGTQCQSTVCMYVDAWVELD